MRMDWGRAQGAVRRRGGGQAPRHTGIFPRLPTAMATQPSCGRRAGTRTFFKEAAAAADKDV